MPDNTSKYEPLSSKPSRVAFWIGWVFSAIPILMMGGGGVAMLFNPEPMKKGMVEQGWPESLGTTILAIEIACAVIYAIPKTAVFGAVLITGYMGGAIATHLRAQDSMWFVPAAFGVVAWLGLFLREPRLRQILPLRR